MRALMLGDVMGRAGRQALDTWLPQLKRRLHPDVVIANGENAAGGYGITTRIANQIFETGVDLITLGNHAFDQAEALTLVDEDRRVLRPANYPERAQMPGSGVAMHQTSSGLNILLITVMGRVYMDALDCPFSCVEDQLEQCELGRDADMIIVEIHGEATSEKNAMGVFCDGRVSAVFGTHTHIPTADARILPGGTAFISDLGMCGDYDSVIGMEKHEPVQRFTSRRRGPRNTPAQGPGTLCGLFVETDDRSGLCLRAEPVRAGGVLAGHLPVSETTP